LYSVVIPYTSCVGGNTPVYIISHFDLFKKKLSKLRYESSEHFGTRTKIYVSCFKINEVDLFI